MENMLFFAEAAAAVGLTPIALGVTALASALGVGLIGMKAAEAVGRNPGAATPILIQSLLAMALVEGIFFVAFFLYFINK